MTSYVAFRDQISVVVAAIGDGITSMPSDGSMLNDDIVQFLHELMRDIINLAYIENCTFDVRNSISDIYAKTTVLREIYSKMFTGDDCFKDIVLPIGHYFTAHAECDRLRTYLTEFECNNRGVANLWLHQVSHYLKMAAYVANFVILGKKPIYRD